MKKEAIINLMCGLLNEDKNESCECSIAESIRVVSQGIADSAKILSENVSEDITDVLLVDIRAKFDLLESLMLEI